MARVTGIGGVFLKARDPKALAKWYAEHLGFTLNQYFNGVNFEWSDEVPPTTGSTVWSLFAEDSKHFGGGPQTAMLNFRVDDLDGLLEQLAAANVPIDPKRDDSDFGKFAWITDPEGNRVELWQPVVEAATPPENE
jgi:predicted enzyme related to lactoylglutathione lyase